MFSWKRLQFGYKAAILGAVISFVLPYFFAPGPYLKAWRLAETTLRGQPKHDAFVILLADLSGDDAEASHRKHLANVIDGMGGFRVVCIGRAIGGDAEVGDQTETRRKAIKDAQDQLEEDGADILIWGKYYKDSFQLGLIPRVRGDKANANAGLADYEIKTLTVPIKLAQQLQDLLKIIIIEDIDAAKKEDGTLQLDKLRPLTPKLEAYLNKAKALPDEQINMILGALNVANATEGNQADDNVGLEKAILASKKVLSSIQSAGPTLAWAAAQLSLGDSLLILGEREEDGASLKAALQAYEASLAVYTRVSNPRQWAMAQKSLGNVLSRLGERESGTKRLEEAVLAYHEALKVFSREQAPLDWAKTQSSLGNTLLQLGEREAGTARLAESVLALRSALMEFTRQRVPLEWAMTQNNLGNALLRIGEREGGAKRLEEAVQAYREALKERTRERVPLDWAMTQNNLGAALKTLGQRESGTERLAEAVQAYREALTERTRERVPLNWAATQNNLGTVLWAMAEKTRDAAKAREALECFDYAREVFAKAAPYYRERVEQNMRNLRAFIEKLDKGRP